MPDLLNQKIKHFLQKNSKKASLQSPATSSDDQTSKEKKSIKPIQKIDKKHHNLNKNNHLDHKKAVSSEKMEKTTESIKPTSKSKTKKNEVANKTQVKQIQVKKKSHDSQHQKKKDAIGKIFSQKSSGTFKDEIKEEEKKRKSVSEIVSNLPSSYHNLKKRVQTHDQPIKSTQDSKARSLPQGNDDKISQNSQASQNQGKKTEKIVIPQKNQPSTTSDYSYQNNQKDVEKSSQNESTESIVPLPQTNRLTSDDQANNSNQNITTSLQQNSKRKQANIMKYLVMILVLMLMIGGGIALGLKQRQRILEHNLSKIQETKKKDADQSGSQSHPISKLVYSVYYTVNEDKNNKEVWLDGNIPKKLVTFGINASFSDTSWSPDQNKLFLRINGVKQSGYYLIDAQNKTMERLTSIDNQYQVVGWYNQEQLIVKTINQSEEESNLYLYDVVDHNITDMVE